MLLEWRAFGRLANKARNRVRESARGNNRHWTGIIRERRERVVYPIQKAEELL